MEKTITPPRITTEILSFCHEIDQTQSPCYIPVKPGEGDEVDQCFDNVKNKIKKVGGTQEFGWILWETPGLLIEAEFHSNWISPNGERTDITPKRDGERQILFLPDSKKIFKNELVENLRKKLVANNDELDKRIKFAEVAFRWKRKNFDGYRVNLKSFEDDMRRVARTMEDLGIPL